VIASSPEIAISGGADVRVWGDTAVITAKLWEKGSDDGRPFEYAVWFSDTYVRTLAGWRYVFGQASLPYPKLPSKQATVQIYLTQLALVQSQLPCVGYSLPWGYFRDARILAEATAQGSWLTLRSRQMLV